MLPSKHDTGRKLTLSQAFVLLWLEFRCLSSAFFPFLYFYLFLIFLPLFTNRYL